MPIVHERRGHLPLSRRWSLERSPIKHSTLLYTLALALAPQFFLAQQLAYAAPYDESAPPASSPLVKPPAAPAPATKEKALTDRWLDLTEMSESQRYRRSYDQNGADLFDNGQQRTALSGRIKIDKQDRYFIGFRAESGRFFNWGFADYCGHRFSYYAGLSTAKFTPAELAAVMAAVQAGTKPYNFDGNGWNFYMRDLYGSATPIKQLTVEFGSIPIERGVSSEITSFDDDGFIAGERVRLRDAKHLGVDEISFTSAYLGDITTPNFFARGNRLSQSNYRQVAAKKKMMHDRLALSGEYNWLIGTDTLREAATVKVPELKAVDNFHVELYQRLNDITVNGFDFASGNGFSLSTAKKAGPVSGDVGYASIDPRYGIYTDDRFLTVVGFTLNGDTYGTGKRIYSHLSYQLTPTITAFGFYTHVVAGDDYNYNKQGLNAGIKFDLKALVNSGRRIF